MSRPRSTSPSPPRLLDRAFAVLGLFAGPADEWFEHAIARAVGLPRSTTNRLVRALEHLGYLEASVDGGYRLGSAAVALGRRAGGADLRDALVALARETGETAVLAVPEGGGLRCVDRIESTHRLRLSLDVGVLVPYHAGATSKAALAFLPAAEIERVLAGPLPRLAPGTITDPAALRRDLALTRERGYAASEEETSEGAWGVAAPVLVGGDVVAVLATIGPTARGGPEERDRAREAVVRAAAVLH